MPATNYFEGLLLGHAVHQKPFSIEDWYVGLFLSDPTASGSLVGEVSAGEYERRPVLWSPTFTNANEISFTQATVDWGAVSHVAVLNSPNKASGNMLVYQPHAGLVTAGIRVKILPGDLTLAIV